MQNLVGLYLNLENLNFGAGFMRTHKQDYFFGPERM
jgi:hypothetical protein